MPLADTDLGSDSSAPDEKLLGALFEPAGEKKAPGGNRVAPVASNGSQAPREGQEEASVELSPEDLPEEPELEAQPQQTALDDDLELEVTIDEQPVKVKLKDLKSDYAGRQATTKRYEEAAKARNAAQQQAQWLYEANQQSLQRIQQLDNHLQRFAEPDISPQQWEWLRNNNPAEYAARREDQRIAREQRAALQAEAQGVSQAQARINEEARARYLDEQAEALRQKLPELSDPEKAKALMGDIQATIGHYGYTDEELKEVTDHRVFHALRDLSIYRGLLAKKAGQRSEPLRPSTMLRAGLANPPSVGQKARQAEIINRARKTGHPDDVAMTLLVPAQGRR